MQSFIKLINKRQSGYSLAICSMLLLLSFQSKSQITIYPVQNFNFGKFYPGPSGGTIEISTAGSRTATGDIILISSGSSEWQAIFDLEAPADYRISIIGGLDAVLEGSNGGQLTLRTGTTNPVSPFNFTAEPGGRMRIEISGSLIIPAASPPGNYQGTFYVTFNNE